MEEKLTKLMAQLGLIAVVIFIVCVAFGGGKAAAPAAQGLRHPLGKPVGDMSQPGGAGVVAPYAQPSFQRGGLIGG
jgi:hypothetical protein